MNRSKIIALTLGPCLAVAALLTGYWVKRTHSDAAPDAPLELHGSVLQKTSSAVPAASGLWEAETIALVAPRERATEPSDSQPALTQAEQVLPKFDVIRVEPRGDAVVAGHAQPNAAVSLLSNGQMIAEAKADAAGQFVLLPTLPAGEHSLALSVTASNKVVTSEQHVVVSVPEKGQSEVLVALAEPGKATVLLKDPTARAEKAEPKASQGGSKSESSGKPEVAIKTAEVVEPGGFFATGQAAPGAHVRLYLNGSGLTDVTAGADGRWSVKIGKGLVPGKYVVRADQLDPKGSVIARAEVPFDYKASLKTPVAAAEKPAPAKPTVLAQNGEPDAGEIAAAMPEPEAIRPSTGAMMDAGATGAIEAHSSVAENAPQNAIVSEVQTTTVEKGNNLWRISRATLGRGRRYTEIYTANATQIRDPRLIYPGQIFVIPGQMN